MNLERQFLSFRWALGTTNQNCPNAISFYFASLGEFLGTPSWQNYHIVPYSFFIWELFFSWLVSDNLGTHIVPLQEWEVTREKGDSPRDGHRMPVRTVPSAPGLLTPKKVSFQYVGCHPSASSSNDMSSWSLGLCLLTFAPTLACSDTLLEFFLPLSQYIVSLLVHFLSAQNGSTVAAGISLSVLRYVCSRYITVHTVGTQQAVSWIKEEMSECIFPGSMRTLFSPLNKVLWCSLATWPMGGFCWNVLVYKCLTINLLICLLWKWDSA